MEETDWVKLQGDKVTVGDGPLQGNTIRCALRDGVVLLLDRRLVPLQYVYYEYKFNWKTGLYDYQEEA